MASRGGARDARPVLDLASALDLVAAAVTAGDASGTVVDHALAAAASDDGAAELVPLARTSVRCRYRSDALPVRLTLGALAVLDAAQRAQFEGRDVLTEVERVARRYLDLLPPHAFAPTVGMDADVAAPGVPG